MAYLIGKELMNYLNNKDNILIWDIDGVICVYAYGDHKINACSDAEFEEYCKEHDVYADGTAPKKLVDIVNSLEPGRQYVCSKDSGSFEEGYKRDYIARNYNIPDDHVKMVQHNSDKLKFMKELRWSLGISPKNIAMIDDNIEVLCEIDEDDSGFTTIHISSFV